MIRSRKKVVNFRKKHRRGPRNYQKNPDFDEELINLDANSWDSCVKRINNHTGDLLPQLINFEKVPWDSNQIIIY